MNQSLKKLLLLAATKSQWPKCGRNALVNALAVWGLFALAGMTQAATAVWIGPVAGGNFQTPTNWTTNPNPPLAGDLVIIGGLNGTLTYSSSTPVLLHTFFTEANFTTTMDVGAGQSHSTSALLIVGSDNPNRNLTIPSGTVNVGTTLFVGSGLPADDCDLIITGGNTLVRTSNAGVGSGGVFVGVGGDNPTLTIQQGADLLDTNPSAGLVAVGLQRTNNGLLTVTGTGSTLSTLGDLQVGSNNDPGNPDMFNNQAKVLDGGSLTAGRMLIGVLPSSKQNTVTVSGAGSVMNLTRVGASSTIGRQSITNTLLVDNGGLIDGNNQFVVGQDATSTGNAVSILSGGRINGTNFDVRRGTATITNGSVYLKQFFNSTTMLNDGGKLIANTGPTGTIAFNSGTIESVGADINNGSAFTVGNGGANSATYRMVKGTAGLNGTHTFANGLSLSSNAILSGNGNIVGTVAGAAGAQVTVGTSPGLINVTGAWNNNLLNVGLEVDNLATLPAQPGVGYDLLDVTGTFTHGGTVNIDVTDYAPGSGFVQDLKIIGWTSELGSNASTAVSFQGGPALPYQFRSDGLYLTNVSFSFIPEPTTVVMLLFGAIPGIMTRRRRPALLD